jgi:hypothetical protein
MQNYRTLKPLFEDDIIIVDTDDAKDQIKIFYDHFVNDFITNPFLVKGKRIKLYLQNSKIKKFNEYPETFVHIITREIKLRNERFYECNRANRIHWIKPILLAQPCRDILYYRWKDEKGVIKDHYWYFSKDFMVVLKEYEPEMQIVTAFCVDDKIEKARFYERYCNYKEGK